MRQPRLVIAAVLVAVAALASSASANHSITELVSTGPDAGDVSGTGTPVLTSADGSRVFFATTDRLVGSDGDDIQDVYERSGGVTTLISTGPTGGTKKSYNGPNYLLDAGLLAVSSDGSRVTFSTGERLTGDDQDTTLDIYQRAGGTTTLVSTGPTDRPTTPADPYEGEALFGGASVDGTHVTFVTDASLVSADTDTLSDVYERFNNQTELVSTGPTDNGQASTFYYPEEPRSGISDDGAHIFFWTGAKLVPEDVDQAYDFYERTAGTTKLVTTGPTDTGTPSGDTTWLYYFDRSDDGTRAVFATKDRLVAQDTDNLMDVYERAGNTTTLVSTGPLDTQTWPVCVGLYYNCPVRISGDGTHIFFFTHESLTAEDTGGYLDLYDRSGGTVKLVSIGPTGGNGPVHVSDQPIVLSKDGSHVFFMTTESLVPEDTDTALDIYERANGTTTTLVSTGPTDPGASVHAPPTFVSEDGTRLFWPSSSPLVPEDTNTTYDIYERYAGATTLIGPDTGNSFPPSQRQLGVSPDGTHAFFSTADSLLPEDNDACGCLDVYAKVVAGASATAASTSVLPNYGAFSGDRSNALP